MSANDEIGRGGGESDRATIRRLEHELDATRHELQTHIEELRSANEELRTSNDEYQTVNEEMRSLNEKLVTVNGQLQATNNDLNNFLSSTRMPILFLDPALNIRRFSPAMAALAKLSPADAGRPLGDTTMAALGAGALTDARAVLERLIPVGREVAIGDLWFMRTTFPYRTGDNRIEGVVVTFIDGTHRRKAEEALRESEERYRAITNNTPDHILVQNRDLRYEMVVNPQLGFTESDMVGKTDYDLLSKDEADRLTEVKRRVIETGEAVRLETPATNQKGEANFFDGSYVPRYDAQGRVNGLIGYFKDVTDRKKAEDVINRHAQDLRAANSDLTRFNRAMIDRENRMIEMKREVNELCRKLGTAERYEMSFEKR